MSNFNITFTHPWLLLLLIPAFAIVLFAYFTVSKQYRRNRNRVISVVLGMIAATCSVFLVSGLSVSYDEKNRENELILVVDASDSNAGRRKEKDEYVQAMIRGAAGVAKIGVVTFGKDQVYAAELTDDADEACREYLNAENPDDSATDIAAALVFAHGKLSNPKAGKLLLISDGIETDGDALTQVAKIAAEGVSVDAVQFPNGDYGKEIGLMQVELPEQTVIEGENVQIGLSLKSSVTGDAVVTLYDNGNEIGSTSVTLSKGVQNVFFTHAFEGTGLHELAFVATSTDDTETINNKIYSYVYLDVFDKILILERSDESGYLKDIVSEKYKADVKNVRQAPATLEELRGYDQVILNNVANADMPEGFIEILHEYVYEIGGGLLTVGGVRMEGDKEVANVYDREDMQGTLYQEMLPVEAEDYTPPVAIMLVMDTSGSMGTSVDGGKTQMDEAKESAVASLAALDDRDYLGVIRFDNEPSSVLKITPLSQREKITQTIKNIRANSLGATVLPGALQMAGQQLSAFGGVNKKHIVVVTDGDTTDFEECLEFAEHYYENYGITTSVIDYKIDNEKMDQLAAAGHGTHYVADDGDALADAMREDFSNPEIRDYQLKNFQPTFGEYSSIFSGVKEEDIPSLDGFFGTKIKEGAQSLLIGEYGEPIYAQWTYGKGKVGSFMCDLSGRWSEEFVTKPDGKKMIECIAGALFPTASVHDSGIDVDVSADNCTASVNVSTEVADGEYIQVAIKSPEIGADGQNVVSIYEWKDFSGYETLRFGFTAAGVYEIDVRKLSASGEIVAQDVSYREFSYSLEYDPFLNDGDNAGFLTSLAANGKGEVVSSAEDVFGDFVQFFFREYDPRILLASVILAAVLLDVAVRKFKFKWPHELIREKREKRQTERRP